MEPVFLCQLFLSRLAISNISNPDSIPMLKMDRNCMARIFSPPVILV
jgi:hypothetical protein